MKRVSKAVPKISVGSVYSLRTGYSVWVTKVILRDLSGRGALKWI